ncbi:chemotaxis protein CheW [Desulfatirhabdium butyrativorans]|uniref:chemotaxis protein CheW n=1 Tax=Desulfatirhabdium butyrativorans TaxID=340467 RepID=UPI0003FE7C96|nr:chemotaxis protein CheW [Desulfatirhabdium butyrativorans]
MDVLTFRIDQAWFALDAGIVQRVVEEQAVYPIPCMPALHRGLLFYRGELFDVIDLGLALHNTPAQGRRLMLVKWKIHAFAFLADAIGAIRAGEEDATGRIVMENGDGVRLLAIDRLIETILENCHGPGEIPADIFTGI